MKVIILGDIHANLPALLRALEEADAEGWDAIVHTGDLIGFGPHVNEVVDLLRARGIAGVRGNLDEAVAAGDASPRAPLADEATTRLAAVTLAWAAKRLSPAARRHLGDLPFEIRLPSGHGDIALYHANPFDLTTYFPPGAPRPALEACVEAAGAGIVVTGHAHTPFHRELLVGHFVGAASVGLPRDGDPRGGYTAISIGRTVSVERRRFAYDMEVTVRDALAAGLPEAIAGRYRQGR